MIRADPTLIHQFLENSASEFADRCALVYGGRRASYAEIDVAANSLANWMLSNAVGHGDRVVLLLGNGMEYVVSYYAILKVGAVAVPLNPEVKPSGLKQIIGSLEAKLAILSQRKYDEVFDLDFLEMGVSFLLIDGDQRSLSQDDGCVRVPWKDLVSDPVAEAPSVPVVASDLASIIYTSGSTGTPKGVMLTHRNIVANTNSIVEYLKLSSDDIQMVVLPFFYVMGKSLLNTHFAVGGRVVINNHFAFAATVIKQMIEEKVTGISGVPSTYAHLLHKSPLAKCREQLGSLRYCSQAGGHMPRATKETLLKVLPEHVQLYVMYGATEASARLSYVEPDQLMDKMDSIGKPIPGVSMNVLGLDGVELPTGQIGEVVAQGENITSGYWRDPGATQAALSDNGYHTGDLGYRDQDGYFFLAGRKDHQLKVGGHRINPVEVEEVLMSTGLALEAAVLGVPDPLMGNKLVAIVATSCQEPDARKILSICAKKLAKHKMPQDVLHVKSLPKNGAGKVDTKACELLFKNSIEALE